MILKDAHNNRFGLNMDPFFLSQLVSSGPVAVSNFNDGLRRGSGSEFGESSNMDSSTPKDAGGAASLGLCSSSRPALSSVFKDDRCSGIGSWFRDDCNRESTRNVPGVVSSFFGFNDSETSRDRCSSKVLSRCPARFILISCNRRFNMAISSLDEASVDGDGNTGGGLAPGCRRRESPRILRGTAEILELDASVNGNKNICVSPLGFRRPSIGEL